MADPSPDVLVIREHLLRHLGPPADVLQLREGALPELPTLEVAFFAPGTSDSPVVFATCGASAIPMADNRRAEGLFMMRPRPTLEQAEVIVQLLGAFASYCSKNGVSIGVGDVIPARAELSTISNMDAVVFVPPVTFVPAFHRIEWKDRVVDVLWLLPVYQDEASYALEHGPGALLTLFAAQGLDLTRLDRDTANTLLLPEDAKTLAASMEKASAAPKAPAPAASPRRLAPTQVRPGIIEDDEGFVVQVKPPKPKKEKKREPEPVFEPPPEPAVHRPTARPLVPPKQPAAHRFDLSRGRAATFVPSDDDRDALRDPKEPVLEQEPEITEEEAKQRRVEELRAAARARRAKKEEE
ncbi:MAG: suppressor of fused domain protein [Deltaproteobacteria bacterium]|nr:suppressor of fused domain protein [Deltaproteobacteria bacterium]